MARHTITRDSVTIRSRIPGQFEYRIELGQFDDGVPWDRWPTMLYSREILAGLKLRWNLGSDGQVKAEASARCRCHVCGKTCGARTVDSWWGWPRCDRCWMRPEIELEWKRDGKQRRVRQVFPGGYMSDGHGCVEKVDRLEARERLAVGV